MGDTLGAQPKHGYETKFHNNWRTGSTFKALNIQFVRHLVIEWNTDALGWWPARQTNQPWKSKASVFDRLEMRLSDQLSYTLDC